MKLRLIRNKRGGFKWKIRTNGNKIRPALVSNISDESGFKHGDKVYHRIREDGVYEIIPESHIDPDDLKGIK